MFVIRRSVKWFINSKFKTFILFGSILVSKVKHSGYLAGKNYFT